MDALPSNESPVQTIRDYHECHGDSAICPLQEKIIRAIKLSCDLKRFNQALKLAREYVTTKSKCPELIAIYCSLSMKLNKSKDVLAYIEEMSTDLCCDIIDKFVDQNFSSFGIQKYLPKFLKLLLNSTVVRLLLTQDVSSSKLSKYLKLWIDRNSNSDDFEKMFKKLIELSGTNNHLFIMFDTLKDFNSGPNNYVKLKWELFIRAITYDLNDYEFMKFDTECNENDLVDEEKNMSNRYLQLAELCYYNKPVQSECLLTAYSLNPNRIIYNLIKGAATINQLKLPEIQEKLCCADLEANTLCDTCGDLIGADTAAQLNDNNRNILSNDCTEQIFSGKVFYLDGNVNIDDEDSLQQLGTDLITILTAPRNKLITWGLPWVKLNKNLLRLLKPENKINLVKQYTSNANSKLQFLKLDYNKFRHLPEPEMPGIEKGYEAYLDSEYETDEDVIDNTKLKIHTNALVYTNNSEEAALKIPETRCDLSDVEFSSSDSVELSIFDLIDNLHHSQILSPIMKKNLSLENVISQSKEISLSPFGQQSLPTILIDLDTQSVEGDNAFVFPLPIDVDAIKDEFDPPTGDSKFPAAASINNEDSCMSSLVGFHNNYVPAVIPNYITTMDDKPQCIVSTSNKENGDHVNADSNGNNTKSNASVSTSTTKNKLESMDPQILPTADSESVNNCSISTDLTNTKIKSEIASIENDDNSVLPVSIHDHYVPHDLPKVVSTLENGYEQKILEQDITATSDNGPVNNSEIRTDFGLSNIKADKISDTSESTDEYISPTSPTSVTNPDIGINLAIGLTEINSKTDMSLVLNDTSNLENEIKPKSKLQHFIPTSNSESVDSPNLVTNLSRTNSNSVKNIEPVLIETAMNSPNGSKMTEQLRGKTRSKSYPPCSGRRTLDSETVLTQNEVSCSSFLNKDIPNCIQTLENQLVDTVNAKTENEQDSEHPTSDSKSVSDSLVTTNAAEINTTLKIILHSSISDENCIHLESPNQENCERNGSPSFKSNNKQPSQSLSQTSIITSTVLRDNVSMEQENNVESEMLSSEIDNIPISDEDHFYPETLENGVNDVRLNEISAWSPVAVAKPEEITEVIKFESPYYFDSDFGVGYEEHLEDDSFTVEVEAPMPREERTTPKQKKSIRKIKTAHELESSIPQEENNNYDESMKNDDKFVIGVFPTGNNDEISEQTVLPVILPEGWGPLKELRVLLIPFIKDCCIPLKRLKLNPNDGSETYKVMEVSNGHEFGFGNVIVLNDVSVQKRILPSINLKPFSRNTKNSNINLKKRKSSANNNISIKRPRVFDVNLQNSTHECDIDSNRSSDEIQFRWATQTIKNYSRPKNKNFHKEGSYIKKYDKRCITPSSLLINSNLYNSTLNKAASKFNGGGSISTVNKDSNVQKYSRKMDKKQAVFNNVPGLKTFEHLKISQSLRHQSVNIIEVLNKNKSNCVNNAISSGNNSANITNNTSNQTVENTTNPSTSGSVFHHFVQFNNANKANVIPHLSEFGPGGTSLQQATSSAIKANQGIVQFLCKTDGKKIQLTPISNQRISHIQINRISNENETNSQERENQATETILPKFNQAFNSRTATIDSSEQSGTPAITRSLPGLSKLQITPSRPLRISMPVIQKSNSNSSTTSTTSNSSRSIIQFPLRQLNQMSQNLGVSTLPRQVLITTAPTRINSITPVVTTPTTDVSEVTTKSNNNSSEKLDTSTLEQLREFDMVLEQVKERSISSCSNRKDESVPVTTTTTPTSVIQKVNIRNVAFIQQKNSGKESPMVVLCGNNTKNRTLHLSTKKVVANTIKPISMATSVPSVTQITENCIPPPSETQPSTIPQKPHQKLQEDEQTVQRIYDILAEYAEQLRNSPDLKNKPAPRRRSNPTINTICTTSSQISMDNDSSSNSSITTVAPPPQIKHTINNNGDNDINNTSQAAVLLISPAARKTQVIDDRVAAVATRKVLISEAALPKATVPNKTTIPPTSTQPILTNKFYPNNCIPLNMMMKRQQITILSGSKILTTLSSHQKSNITNDPIILKTINSTNNSIKSLNNITTRSFSNTSSPIFVLSSNRNISNKSSTEIMINSINNDNSLIKSTTHTATSTTHSATTTSFNQINNKIGKESSSILEKEIKLQKSLSEECEDLGVDEPSASELFPEADLLLDANPSSPILTSSLEDDYQTTNHYFLPTTTTTLLQNNNKTNIETDMPCTSFNRNGSSGNKHINKKRVYGSSNWLRRYGNHTRKMVKLTNSSIPLNSLETTTSTSMDDISVTHSSKSILKRR